MRIMLTGDVVGRPGRKAFMEYTPKLRREKNIDVVIVNGENSAGGKGFTRKAVDELYRGGADIITSGNHVWDKKDVLSFIDQEPFLPFFIFFIFFIIFFISPNCFKSLLTS